MPRPKPTPEIKWYRLRISESNETTESDRTFREFQEAKNQLGIAATAFVNKIKDRLRAVDLHHRVELSIQSPVQGRGITTDSDIYRVIISYPDPLFTYDTRNRHFTVAPCPPPNFDPNHHLPSPSDIASFLERF